MTKNTFWKRLLGFRWLYLLLILVFFWTFNQWRSNEAVEVGTGNDGRVTHVQKSMSEYHDAVRDYQDKVGMPLRRDGLTKKHLQGTNKMVVETNQQISERYFMRHPSLIQFEGYQLEGIIAEKWRVKRGSIDIITLGTKAGRVKLFYNGGLPNYLRGDKIRVTGTVLGVSHYDGMPMIATSRETTEKVVDK